MFELTPEGMTQSLYTNGLSGETNGNLDRKIVEIRNDSLMTAVCKITFSAEITPTEQGEGEKDDSE